MARGAPAVQAFTRSFASLRYCSKLGRVGRGRASCGLGNTRSLSMEGPELRYGKTSLLAASRPAAAPLSRSLALAREHRPPSAVEGRPDEVVRVHHGPPERLTRLPACGGSHRCERHDGLDQIEGARQELRASPAVNGGTVEPGGTRVEPDDALAREVRGVILHLGPLEPEVVEQRVDDSRRHCVGGAVEVSCEPDFDAPTPHEMAEHAARRDSGHSVRPIKGPCVSQTFMQGARPAEERPDLSL